MTDDDAAEDPRADRISAARQRRRRPLSGVYSGPAAAHFGVTDEVTRLGCPGKEAMLVSRLPYA